MAVPAQTLLPPTDNNANLQVPAASVRAFAVALGGDYDDMEDSDRTEFRAAFAAGAPHVVASELRRLAQVFITADSRDEAAVLLGRADQLDGGSA